MSLNKQDKKEIKETIQDEIIDVVAEAIQPEFDKLGSKIGVMDKKIDKLAKDLSDFKQETKNNFMDVRRQISDLNLFAFARHY